MKSNDIIKYYDYLMRLAALKCNSHADAEDLVGDTILAAFTYMHSGKIIEYPKTWLTNTLYHKHNDILRKKYRFPVTVCLDEVIGIPDEEGENDRLKSEEAAKIRKELNYLAYITREVIIRFYYGNQSIETIAKDLDIPKGTVKSRLYTGRSQIKKGLETMESRKNYLPGQLCLSFGGQEGLNNEPMSLVENDLMAQNLLIIAYEKPLSISELSKAIGIPAAYIEPIVNKMVDGELMIQTVGGKVYTDFIITKPQNSVKNFKPQFEFAHRNFDVIWDIITKTSKSVAELDCVQNLCEKQKIIIDRYAVLKALQDFQHYGTGKIAPPDFPKRKDGGWWYAEAVAFEAGYNTAEYQASLEYLIHGGHRKTHSVSIDGVKEITLCEFDTTLWDNPQRYAGESDMYFKYIIPLLWYIYREIPLGDSGIPNNFIAYMPHLESAGLIGYCGNKAYVKIPVIEKCGYDEIIALIHSATEEMKLSIGEKFEGLITSMKTDIPKHLTSVPELYRYKDACGYFTMSIVREAYNKGLHLKGVDYICPPAVLVYEK